MTDNIVTWRDMRIDDADSGLPRLTLWPDTDRAVVALLAPEAVTALVDALAGTAQPRPGEVRIIVKADASALASALGGLRPGPVEPVRGPFRRFEECVAKMAATGALFCRGGGWPHIELLRSEDDGRPVFRAWHGAPSLRLEPWTPTYADLTATDWQPVP
jgi:hypothetical protein